MVPGANFRPHLRSRTGGDRYRRVRWKTETCFQVVYISALVPSKLLSRPERVARGDRRSPTTLFRRVWPPVCGPEIRGCQNLRSLDLVHNRPDPRQTSEIPSQEGRGGRRPQPSSGNDTDTGRSETEAHTCRSEKDTERHMRVESSCDSKPKSRVR